MSSPTKKQKELFQGGVCFQTSLSFELEKIFGMAYEEKLPLNQLDVKKYRSFKKNSRRKSVMKKS